MRLVGWCWSAFLLSWGCSSCGASSSEGAAPPPEAQSEAIAEPAAPVDPSPADPQVAAPSSEEVGTLAAATSRFGLELYREAAPERGSFAMSPASVATALAMTAAGARGETATQMTSTLHLDALDDPHAAFGAQLAEWNAEGRPYVLSVANRIYAERTITWEPSFVALTRDRYGAPVEGVDFRGAPAEAGRQINAWVSEQTHERIREIVSPGMIARSTAMVLVNAVYFDGQWLEPFDPEATAPRDFWVDGRTRSQVPTMQKTGRFRHATVGDVQLLELPYAGETLSMLIALPTERAGIASVEGALTSERLAEWSEALAPTQLEVSLPKFRIETDIIPLKRALTELGMRLPFESDADFTGIGRIEEGLFISDVLHRAFVEVDEEGTEAAAATAVVMVRGAAPSEPVRFVADHPFLFFIRDRTTGGILFLGRVANPAG